MLRPTLVLCLLLAASAPTLAQSAQTSGRPQKRPVPTIFEVSAFASVDRPSGLDLAPAGTGYGADLFVIQRGATSVDPDLVLRIDDTGAVHPFATLLPDADPIALEFPPPGSPFSMLLYVSSNNWDYGQPGDCGGNIQVVDPVGSWADLTFIDGCISCNTDAPGGKGLGEPNGVAFGAGGAIGWDLFVANSTDAPADIMRVGLAGQTSEFVDDGQENCLGLLGFRPECIAVSSGGPFGASVWFGDANSGIRIADQTGLVAPEVIDLGAPVRDLAFGQGGDFGTHLYACTKHTIFSVAPDGSVTEFMTGFDSLILDGLEFSPDGKSLFVSDYGAETIYRIRATF